MANDNTDDGANLGLSDAQVADIVQAVLRLGRRLRAQRPRDSVSIAELSLMAILHERGPMPAARLAEAVRLQPQSLTRQLRDLEARGLITRTPGQDDKRTLIVCLSDAGRAAFYYDIASRHRWLSQVVAMRLDDEEQALLLKAAAVMRKLASED